MKIETPQELAEELVHSASRASSSDEIQFSEPVTSAFIVPAHSIFTAQTVDGRRFRVCVTEEKGA